MNSKTQGKVSAYRQPLILLAFVLIGAVLGLVLGERASFLYPIGQIWLNMLFVILVPLIFFSIAGALANNTDTGKIGKMLGLTVSIFILTGIMASILMLIITRIFPVDTSLEIQAATDTAAALTETESLADRIVSTLTVSDFSEILTRQHILPLIIFTIFFGISVSTLGEKGKPIAQWLEHMSLVFYQMINLLMKLAPIGIGCYFANLTGTYGPDLLASYAKGLLVVYPTLIVYFFGFLGLLAFIGAGKWGIRHFFREIFSPALMALGTRSSAATLPLQLRACDNIGVPREVSSVVVPMGATCHMDGASLAAIYEIALCCAIFNRPFGGMEDYLFAILIAVIGSVAQSSIPGGGATFETMLISAFAFPSSALPIIYMMSQLVDPLTTTINSCGDTAVSMVVSRCLYGKEWYRKKSVKEAKIEEE